MSAWEEYKRAMGSTTNNSGASYYGSDPSFDAWQRYRSEMLGREYEESEKERKRRERELAKIKDDGYERREAEAIAKWGDDALGANKPEEIVAREMQRNRAIAQQAEEDRKRRELLDRPTIMVSDGQDPGNFDTQAARAKYAQNMSAEQAYKAYKAELEKAEFIARTSPQVGDKMKQGVSNLPGQFSDLPEEQKYDMYVDDYEKHTHPGFYQWQREMEGAPTKKKEEKEIRTDSYTNFANDVVNAAKSKVKGLVGLEEDKPKETLVPSTRTQKEIDEFSKLSRDEKYDMYIQSLDQKALENGTLSADERNELSRYKYDHLSDDERKAVDAIMENESAGTKEFGEYGFFGGMQSREYRENPQKYRDMEKASQDAIKALKDLGWDDERIERDVAGFKELADYYATQEMNEYYRINPNAPSKFWKSAENTAMGVYTAPARGIGSLLSENGAYGRNLSSKYRYPVNMSNEAYRQVRENAIGNDHPVGQFLYDAGVSSAESLVTMLTSQAALGGVPAAVGKGLSLVPFAANAYDSSYEDAVNRGFGEKQAQMYGLASGLIEAGTEIFSLDRMWDMASAKKLGRNLVSNAIIQAGIEGTEEVASELGGRLADYLAVEIGETGKTQRQLDIEEYMQDHPWASSEEAANYAAKKFAKEVGLAGLSGMASAALDTSVASMVGAYRSKYGDNLTGAISDRFKNLKVEGDTEYENMLRDNKAKYENNPTQYLADNYKVNSEDDARVKQGLEEIAQKEREGKGLSVSDKAFITKNVVDNREQFNKEFLENLYDTGEDSIVPYKYRDVKTEVTEDQARIMLEEAAQSGDPKAFIDAQRKVRNSTVDEVAKHAEEIIDFYAGRAIQHGITQEDIGKALIAEKQAYIAGLMGEELNKDNLTPEAQIAYNDGKMDALKEATRTTIENKDALNTDVTTKEGNTVTLKGVFTSDGIMTDGGAVKLENIDLDENKATNKAYHFADNYENVTVKNAFLANINDGQNIENYNRDFGRVYDSALAGLSLENVKKQSLTELSNDQIKNIYSLAQNEKGLRAAQTLNEVLNGVKGNKVGKAINESSNQDADTTNMLGVLAVITGHDMVLVDDIMVKDPETGKMVKTNARGQFFKDQGRIVIRADQFNEAVAHEISHIVETYNKADYDRLRDAVANFAVDKMGADKFVNKVLGGYSDRYHAMPGQEKLQADDISGEMFNDIVPVIMKSKKGQKALAEFLARNYKEEEARTMGQQLADFMKGIGNAVKKLFGKEDFNNSYARKMSKYAEELGDMAEDFFKALEKAIDNRNKALTGESVSESAGESGARYSLNVKSAEEKLGEQIDDWLQGKMPQDGYFEFGETPTVLQSLGVPDLPVIMEEDGILKFTADYKDHTVSLDDIRHLPSEMADPIMVLEGSVPNSYVELTEIEDKKGRPVIVAIHMNRYHDRMRINKIASIYGKNNIQGYLNGKENLVKYADKKRSLSWITSRGLQLPKLVQSINSLPDINIPQEEKKVNYKFSLSEDSTGRELSEGQQEYFNDESPLLMKDGALKRYYHGTARMDRVGTVFRPERATSGPMAFFTDDKSIAENYAKDKEDTSLSRDERYDSYYTQFRMNINGKDVSVPEAWNMLPYSKKAEIKKKAGHIAFDDDYEEIKYYDNKTNGNGAFTPYELNRHKGNYLETLVDTWLDTGDLIDREEDFLKVLELVGLDNVEYLDPDARNEGVYEVYIHATNPLDTSNIPKKVVTALKKASKIQTFDEMAEVSDMWDKNRQDPATWIKRLEEDIKDGTTHSWTSIPDWVTATLKALGYDAISDQGGKYHDHGHQVVIPFASNQVKSIDNLNPTEHEDIRFSIADENRIMYVRGLDHNIEVVKNPTSEEYRQMQEDFYEQYPWAREWRGEPIFRHTYDEEGNTYYWVASEGLHSQIEPEINKHYKTRTSQHYEWWLRDDKDEWPVDYGARYSLSKDSDGRELSEDQIKYFRNAEIRDDDGRLLQMYHGTNEGGFTIFDPTHSDDGLSLFFSDNEDVARTYTSAGTKFNIRINPYRDEKAKITDAQTARKYLESQGYTNIHEIDGGWTYTYPNGETQEVEEDTMIRHAESRRMSRIGTYAVYLDIQNPLVVEGGNKIDGIVDDLTVSKYKNITAFTFTTPTGIDTIKIDNSKVDSYIEETFGNDADRVKQAVGSIGTISFEDFSEAVKDYTDGENFVIRDGNDVVVMEGGEATDDIEIYRGTLQGAIDFFNKTMHINVPLRADISKRIKNVNVNTVVPSNWNNIRFNGGRANTRYISSYAHEHGYDGVFFKNIIDNGGGFIEEEKETKASNIAIAFHSDQVKSIYNLHPTDDPDIRYSISEDSEGRELAEGQQKYFQKSQALDEEGRLLSLYHGTVNAGFTDFNDKDYIYLSTSKAVAKQFSDDPFGVGKIFDTRTGEGSIYNVYANITNPLIVDGMRSIVKGKVNADIEYQENTGRYNLTLTEKDGTKHIFTTYDLSDYFDDKTVDQINNYFDRHPARGLYDVTKYSVKGKNVDIQKPSPYYDVEFNGESMGTDAIADYAKEHGYDGVIVRNVVEGSDATIHGEATTDVIAFSSKQIKSVDNLNPTSSKDIRFSFEDEGGWIDFDEVLGESRSEEKAVDILEKGMEALKNKDVDVPKLRTLALKIRNEYGSSYNANKLADDLRKAFAYMQTEDHVDYQTMMGILKDIARPVIEEAGEKVGEEEYKHFLEYFKGKKIKLTSTQKEEVRHTFGSYGAYRNAMMPITISDNGEFTLDQLWDEMVQHGGYMLDIDANEGDMPINLLDTLQAMRPYVRNDFGGDTEDLAKDLAMRIVEEYIQGESAKEMHKELTEYRNRLKKDYQERLKDLKGRANAEVLARNKRRAEEKAERQKARDLKVKIKQNANKLYTWAVKPTEGKSVPHNMMVPVMQFLQGIDFVDPVITVSDDGKYHIRLFDRADYEDGNKKFIYKDLVGDTREDVLRQFNEAIGRGEGTKEQRSWTDKMQGIRDIYNKVLNDTDFEDTDMDFLMQTLDAQGLAEEFDDLLSRHKGQASMNSLSSKELELINNIIQNIFHAVNQGNKAFSQPSVDIVNLAQSTMKDAEGKEIKSRNRFMEGLHKMLRLDNVTPRTFFKLLGKRGSEVYKFLRGGLNQEIIDLKKASEFMEEAMKGINAKTWTGRSATIHEIPVSEGTIRLTDAQIMGLYMTIRRNGGKDRIKGGVKIDDIRTKGRPIQQKAMHLTDADIEKIEAILTPEQIALAKKMQQYMAKDCSEQGNDTSMRLYGFKKFTDDTYYPWTVDKDTVATTNTSENIPMFTGIERSGFTKQLKEGATNPLVIRDIFDVFTDHVSQMAAYHGYAASVKDTLRWMNYRERSDADGFVNWHTNKKAINDLTGSKQGVGYIRNLLLDINKANKSQYIGNFTDLLIGNYKAAAVGANLRVVAQQPTAYFRALNMIDPKYLLTVNPATAIKNIKRSQEQSPISWWKSKGYYETNLGQPIKEIVTGITSPAEKAKDIMMAPAGWADDFTWGFLYTAVEKEQRDLLKGQNLTAEQFRQAVNDRFDEVVDNTQVVDSTLHRSQYMRSTDRLNKIQTAFMAEPTKSYNMLLEAFLEDRNDKSGKRTTRAIAAFLLSSLATSAAAAVVDAMRKAKDDEDWWEVWLKNLQENAADNINPFNLLPVVKDVSAGIYNLLTGTSTFGQSGNRFDIEAISSIMSAAQMIPKLIEGESNKTGYGAALTMIKPISQITGIPVYNLTKDAVALYNTFFDNIETTINSGSTAKNEKKKSFVSDVNRERSEETLDEGIVDAIESGVSIYDLKGAVRSEYKNKYFDAYSEGNTEEAQAIAERAARAYARMGMSDEDIDAEINEWQEETITYALLDKAIASGEGIEEEIRHVQEGKADEKIIKHIMDRFSDTIAYEDVHETESDWRGNVEKALQAIDPTLTFDTANEEAMQQAAEKAAEQQAKEEKAGYKADFFASVESKNGTAGRKALDGLKAMGVDAKSAKTMVSTQYHDAWKEAKTPAEKQKARSDWMSAYKLVCNYYGVEYKDLDKTWSDWEKDQ